MTQVAEASPQLVYNSTNTTTPMSNEELPEDQHYETESIVFKEVLAKYFNGEVPTEKARKDAFKLLYDTSVFNKKGWTDEDDFMQYNMNGY